MSVVTAAAIIAARTSGPAGAAGPTGATVATRATIVAAGAAIIAAHEQPWKSVARRMTIEGGVAREAG